MPRRKRSADPITQPPLDSAAAPASASPPPRKRARRFKTPPDARVHRSYKPRASHRNHPDSGVGENFHSVPYLLGLLPYSSWHVLHHRRDPSSTEHHFVCPACRKHRSFPSAYRQKLFLVAERLSWEDGVVPTAERELNQELTWEVNFQLGIEDPVTDDPEQVPGGKNSKTNQWFPFESEVDCATAMKLIARADCLSERSYGVWLKMMDTLYTILHAGSEKEASASTGVPSQLRSGERPGPLGDKAGESYLPTPPSSSQPFGSKMSQDPDHSHFPVSTAPTPDPAPSRSPFSANGQTRSARPAHRSLQEFFSLLDAIERTSYVGAQYLEAYAEHLRDDLCNDCCLRRVNFTSPYNRVRAMAPPPGAFFAHQESLRCQLLRELVRRNSLSRERTPNSDESSTSSQEEPRPDSSEPVTPVTPATPATVEVEPCTSKIDPCIPKTEPYTPKADSVTPNIEPVTSEVEITTPEAGPTIPEAEFPMRKADPMDSEDEAPWQYPKKAWRQNSIVKRYEDEAFVFIRADSFPTDPEATVPLIGWLRMHDKLCTPSKPLHSGVVRVETVGWIITLGHDSGAMDRMILLLERKTGQNFMFKGKMHKITMDTHMPLDEWMP